MRNRIGIYKVPRPFQDEDKWAKLTKRQWAIILPAGLLAIGAVTFFNKLHLVLIGIILAIIVLMIAVGILLFDIPADKYLFGSGVKIERLGLRLIVKKIKPRKIYTKHYNNGYEV